MFVGKWLSESYLWSSVRFAFFAYFTFMNYDAFYPGLKIFHRLYQFTIFLGCIPLSYPQRVFTHPFHLQSFITLTMIRRYPPGTSTINYLP